MEDQLPETEAPEENLTDEFRALGKNFFRLLQSAWESPERKQVQQEIATGLTELRTTLEQEMDKFNQSPTGQRLRSEVQDVADRIQNGEVEANLRKELVSALQIINKELEKAMESLSKKPPEEGGS